jgi:hypothetical protein
MAGWTRSVGSMCFGIALSIAASAAAGGVEIELVLRDGTRLLVEHQQVYRVDAKGRRTPVRSGSFVTGDGKTVVVKDGHLVKERAGSASAAKGRK